MRVTRILSAVVLSVVVAGAAWAKDAEPLAQDPALEKKVDDVTAELRCLVCQNQTIADSHAELAIDLKNQVREMMRQGQTKDDVVNYMVQRYGDFVRYKPPMKPTTYLLWFGPALLVVIGLVVLFTTLRKRSQRLVASAPLSEDEHKKVDALLHAGEGDRKS
jgi:cytochrome c-type biogenesis protein CcmH